MLQATVYTRTAIGLHWLIALLICSTFVLGIYMHELPFSPQKLQYYSWHKWAGVSIFLLVCARLAWRLSHTPPPPVASMPVWQQHASEWAHRALYLLMLIIPLSGWLMSSAKGVPTVWFGLVQLPDLVAKNADLGEQLKTTHQFLNFGLQGLVLLHIAAALKHHLIDKDNTLRRMLPWLKPRN